MPKKKEAIESSFSSLLSLLSTFHASVLRQPFTWPEADAQALTEAVDSYVEALVNFQIPPPESLQEFGEIVEAITQSERPEESVDGALITIQAWSHFVVDDLDQLRAVFGEMIEDPSHGEILGMVLHLWELGDADLLARARVRAVGGRASAVYAEDSDGAPPGT